IRGQLAAQPQMAAMEGALNAIERLWPQLVAIDGEFSADGLLIRMAARGDSGFAECAEAQRPATFDVLRHQDVAGAAVVAGRLRFESLAGLFADLVTQMMGSGWGEVFAELEPEMKEL